MNRPVPGPLRPAGAGEARGISQLFPVSPGALTGSPDMTMRSGPGRAMASGHANRALPGRRPGPPKISQFADRGQPQGEEASASVRWSPAAQSPRTILVASFTPAVDQEGRNA